MDYKYRPSADAKVQTPLLTPLPIQRLRIPERTAQLQRQAGEQLAAHTLRPTSLQRQHAGVVFQALHLQRQVIDGLSAQRSILEQHVADHQGVAGNLEGALQRQAERQAPVAPLMKIPARPADWVQAAKLEIQRVQDPAQPEQTRWMTGPEHERHLGTLRGIGQGLARGFKTNQEPAGQRYAEYGDGLATLQRHALTVGITRSVLQQTAPTERLLLQRAVDEALQRQQQEEQQDASALHLHSLQRQLADLDHQAEQPIMERIQARRGSGVPLPAAVQRQLEAGLNHDLSGVRIHTDGEADLLSRKVNATAFTSGQDIYFQSGRFDPNSQSGVELLAHEVTHTVQQTKGQVGKGIDPDAGLEAEARQMGTRIASRAPSRSLRPATPQRSAGLSGQALQRQVAPVTPSQAKADEGARQLQQLVLRLTTSEPTMGSAAALLFGMEKAADLRLGSSRKLVQSKGFMPDPRYASLDGANKELIGALTALKKSGQAGVVLAAYQRLYGQSFTAILGERVRDPLARQRLMTLLPAPISDAQLTRDAFLEQVAVQYVYMNDSGKALTESRNDGRRGSDPQTILKTFGYRAGPPIAGKWGFQMRTFYPLTPGLHPIVAFRGTEGIAFDLEKKKEGTIDTVIGDLAPAGVGYDQYTQNHALIALNMQAAAKGGPLIIVGHSLGGALAQIAATEFRAQTAEVVTFQAAAISAQDVAKVTAYNQAHLGKGVKATHYRVDGDVVPTAGQADLPGTIHYFDRVERPKGSTKPFELELSADAVNTERASSGHVSPVLSTYLRGQGQTTGALGSLATSGLRDEQTLEPKGKDVQMIYGGQYSTQHDPRMILEPKRTTTAVWAMDTASMYSSVYYDQIAYNTLLAYVETLAQARGATYTSFIAAARKEIVTLGGKGRLPLRAEDEQLSRQLDLPVAERDFQRPIPVGLGITYARKDAPIVEMREHGVLISVAAGQRVLTELGRIWDSWHPEAAK